MNFISIPGNYSSSTIPTIQCGSDGPLYEPDEVHLLSVPNVRITYHYRVASVKLDARGIVHLTTRHLYLQIHDDPGGTYCVVVSLPSISNERFKQPVFGANFLSATTVLVDSTSMQFKLIFDKGGAGVFMPQFFRALRKARFSESDDNVSIPNLPEEPGVGFESVNGRVYL
ncbi:hypothetical protein P9112_005738 [Eukaryota sp. TZLM1-RC]